MVTAMECVPLNEWKDWALSLEIEKGKRQGESWSSSSTVKGFEPSVNPITIRKLWSKSRSCSWSCPKTAGRLTDRPKREQDFDQSKKKRKFTHVTRDELIQSLRWGTHEFTPHSRKCATQCQLQLTSNPARNEQIPCAYAGMNSYLN